MPADIVLAVDLGATNLRCALVAPEGTILARAAITTPFDETVLEAIGTLAADVCGSRRVDRAVIGVPGRVDYEAGVLDFGRGQPDCWRDLFTETRLTDVVGVPVHLANDADMAAVGEAFYGAGAGADRVAYLTISTGVGAGAVLDGQLFRSRLSLLEMGLTVVQIADADRVTVIEDIASGRALHDAAESEGLSVMPRDLVRRAAEGDDLAQRLWQNATRASGVAAANLAHILNPDVIVIGGGVAEAGEALRRKVEEAVRDHGPRLLQSAITVELTALNDDAGLIGAAAWHRATSSRTHAKSAVRVSPPANTLAWSDALGIPDALDTILSRRAAIDELAEFVQAGNRLYVTGNGASYYVAHALSLAHADTSTVSAIPAGLLAGYQPLDDNDLLLAVSASGELRDIIEAHESGRIRRLAAFTANPGSSIGQLAESTVLLPGEHQRSLTHTQSYCGSQLAALLLHARLDEPALVNALMHLPERITGALAAAWEWVEHLDLRALPESAISFGSGCSWASALETGLLLKEVSGIHCEGTEAREGATSAMFALNERSLAISIPSADDPHYAATADSCRNMGAAVIEIPVGDDDHRLTPITSFPYALALALQLATLAGRNPDKPGWAANYIASVRSTAPVTSR